MRTAWRNKKTGLWLIQDESRTHTKLNTTYRETDDLQLASILSMPDFVIRSSGKYEPVEVVVERTVTLSPQIDIEELQVGDKVHYQPEHYGPDKWENGLIKVIDTDLRKDAVWVVYNCAGIWIGYQKYTAALTNLRDLKLGWKHQPGGG